MATVNDTKIVKPVKNKTPQSESDLSSSESDVDSSDSDDDPYAPVNRTPYRGEPLKKKLRLETRAPPSSPVLSPKKAPLRLLEPVRE